MEREVTLYGIDSCKLYCHTDPGGSGRGFSLDDEQVTYPFSCEKSKQLGLKTVSVPKGFSCQSRLLGHLANPEDAEKAALDHLDLKQDKAMIFGPNGARLYGIDPDERRKRIPGDALSRLNAAYIDMGGMRENGTRGWVRDDSGA